MRGQHIGLVVALAVQAGAPACGRQEPAAATQVAARINGDEITVHQVNHVLARGAEAADESAAELKREVLDRLIDRQIARQQALARKLDRSAAVMQELQDAESEILARAYLAHLAAALPEPTPTEVRLYYQENPALFAQRRIFTLDELVAPMQPGLAGPLAKEVAAGRSLRQLGVWLGARGVRFAESHATRPAEEIPLDMLPVLHAMRPGETRFIEGGGRLNVLRLVSARAAPIDEASAAPRIRQVLYNLRVARTLAQEMAALKRQSSLDYRGEFAAAPPDEQAVAGASPAAQPVERGSFHKAVRGLR